MDARTRSWQVTYRIGAVVALIAVAGTLFDIMLTMVPGWAATTVPSSAAEWFAQFAANPLLGLRNLDLINVALSVVSLPMYVALYGAHRRAEPGLALVALVLVAIGTALFAANNAALPMLDLGRRYASASLSADRLALQAAAEALLARGAHGSLGAFPGFFLSEAGTLVMALALLRGGVFRPVVGWVGIAGTTMLMAYSVAMTAVPGADALVNALAVPGGLLMLAFNVMVARRLLRLARENEPTTA